jgi:hypothetical protein
MSKKEELKKVEIKGEEDSFLKRKYKRIKNQMGTCMVLEHKGLSLE